MTTVTQKLYVFLEHGYDYENGDFEARWRPRILCYKGDDTDERIFVKEQMVTFESPDDFDPTAAQLAALESAKAEALRQYQERVAELNDRISKLQAITHEPAES